MRIGIVNRIRRHLSRSIEALRLATSRVAFGVGCALAVALSLVSCSSSPEVDLSKLRVFFTSDALGYLEPCG
jgi:hypothetical protein